MALPRLHRFPHYTQSMARILDLDLALGYKFFVDFQLKDVSYSFLAILTILEFKIVCADNTLEMKMNGAVVR